MSLLLGVKHQAPNITVIATLNGNSTENLPDLGCDNFPEPESGLDPGAVSPRGGGGEHVGSGDAALDQTISGGPLSTANTLGGFPHFRVGAGFQLLSVRFHQPGKPASDTTHIFLPSEVIQGRAGVMPGIVKGILAIDALYRWDYFPIADMGKPVFYSFGVRMGLVRDKGMNPALAISVLYSTFLKEPKMSNSIVLNGRSYPVYQVLKYSMSIVSYRADFSKRMTLFTPYVGIGLDDYNASAKYTYYPDTLSSRSGFWGLRTEIRRSYAGLQFGGGRGSRPLWSWATPRAATSTSLPECPPGSKAS